MNILAFTAKGGILFPQNYDEYVLEPITITVIPSPPVFGVIGMFSVIATLRRR